MIQGGIYMIFSIVKPERFYIGSTYNFEKRKYEHFYDLETNRHGNQKINRHYKKYGKKDLIFEILEYVEDTTKLIEREQFWIDNLNPYFNIRKVAESNLGIKYSEESKNKMSKALKGKYVGEKSWLYGIKKSEKTRKKISEAKMGDKNPQFGKPISEEAKIKMSISRSGENNYLWGKETPLKTRKKQSKAKDHIKRPVLQFDLDGNFVAKYNSITDARRQTGVRSGNISKVANWKTNTAGGYVWAFKDKL